MVGLGVARRFQLLLSVRESHVPEKGESTSPKQNVESSGGDLNNDWEDVKSSYKSVTSVLGQQNQSCERWVLSAFHPPRRVAVGSVTSSASFWSLHWVVLEQWLIYTQTAPWSQGRG